MECSNTSASKQRIRRRRRRTKNRPNDSNFPEDHNSMWTKTCQGSASENDIGNDFWSESSCDGEGSDESHIRINGAKGNAISLSYFLSIPKREDGSPLSHGSKGHPDKCTPCCFVSRARGCADGILCNMCHDFHPAESYSRRKKQRLRKAKGSTSDDCVNPETVVESPPVGYLVLHVRVKNTFLDCFEPDDLPLYRGQASVRAHSAP